MKKGWSSAPPCKKKKIQGQILSFHQSKLEGTLGERDFRAPLLLCSSSLVTVMKASVPAGRSMRDAEQSPLRIPRCRCAHVLHRIKGAHEAPDLPHPNKAALLGPGNYRECAGVP